MLSFIDMIFVFAPEKYSTKREDVEVGQWGSVFCLFQEEYS
jgi:hypothetical protein